MKHLQQFKLNEGHYNDEDFNFITELSHREVSFINNDQYDDYDVQIARVHWKVRFDWMGNSGVDYYFEVDKVELEYIGISYDENDIEEEEEKLLVIEDPENITFEKTSTDNQQLMAQSVDIDGNKLTVNVEF